MGSLSTHANATRYYFFLFYTKWEASYHASMHFVKHGVYWSRERSAIFGVVSFSCSGSQIIAQSHRGHLLISYRKGNEWHL